MLKEITIFAAGVVVGGAIMTFIVKKQCAKKAAEDIKSVVDTYEKAMFTAAQKNEEEKEKDQSETKPELDLKEKLYSKLEPATKVDEPYAITMEEYERNENGYFQEMLFYYADNVVANVNDEVIDVDNTIGREALRILDESIGDKIYIRNEALEMEWEVNNDPRDFKEVTEDWSVESDGDDD